MDTDGTDDRKPARETDAAANELESPARPNDATATGLDDDVHDVDVDDDVDIEAELRAHDRALGSARRRPWIIAGSIVGVVLVVIGIAVVIVQSTTYIRDDARAALTAYTDLIAEGRFDEARSVPALAPSADLDTTFLASTAASGRTATPSDFRFERIDASDSRIGLEVAESQILVRVHYLLDGEPAFGDLRVAFTPTDVSIIDPLIVAVGVTPAVPAPLVIGDARLELADDHGFQRGLRGSIVTPVHLALFPGEYALDGDYAGYYDSEPAPVRATAAPTDRFVPDLPLSGRDARQPHPDHWASAADAIALEATPTQAVHDAVSAHVAAVLEACFPAVDTDGAYYEGNALTSGTGCNRYLIGHVMVFPPVMASIGWQVTPPTIDIRTWWIGAEGGRAVLSYVYVSSMTPATDEVTIEFTGRIRIIDGALTLSF